MVHTWYTCPHAGKTSVHIQINKQNQTRKRESGIEGSRRTIKSRAEISETVDRKSIQKINKAKSFGKINASEKLLATNVCDPDEVEEEEGRWGDGVGPTEMKAGPSFLSPPTLKG